MAIRDLREHECRFGAKNVRSYPESRHWMTVFECSLWANSGHLAPNQSFDWVITNPF